METQGTKGGRELERELTSRLSIIIRAILGHDKPVATLCLPSVKTLDISNLNLMSYLSVKVYDVYCILITQSVKYKLHKAMMTHKLYV